MKLCKGKCSLAGAFNFTFPLEQRTFYHELPAGLQIDNTAFCHMNQYYDDVFFFGFTKSVIYCPKARLQNALAREYLPLRNPERNSITVFRTEKDVYSSNLSRLF